MKKKAADNFYLHVTMWTFFCLIAAGISYQIRAGFITMRDTGYESDVLQVIQTITVLQKQYAAKNRGRFARSFEDLITSEDANGFFENLGGYFNGEVLVGNGYVYQMKVSEPTAQRPAFYAINADPAYCEIRCKSFYYDSTKSLLKGTDENRPARADDPAI